MTRDLPDELDTRGAERLRWTLEGYEMGLADGRATRPARLQRALGDLWTDLTLFVVYPKCPLCAQRTRNIEAHLHLDHAGDPRG